MCRLVPVVVEPRRHGLDSTCRSSCCSCSGVLFAALSLVASALLAPRKRPTAAKQAPYECGIVPDREPPQRFPVRFYLVAMIFIIFDIEIIFLYPFAVIYRQLGRFGLVEVIVFAAVGLRLASSTSSPTAPSTGARPSSLRPARCRRTPHHRIDHRAVSGPTPGRRRAEAAWRSGVAAMGLEDLQHNFLTGQLEDLVKWSRAQQRVAGDLRPGLLRHRDDGRRRRPTTTSPASAWRCSGPRRARPT